MIRIRIEVNGITVEDEIPYTSISREQAVDAVVSLTETALKKIEAALLA
jgi:hypothetical protein